MIAWDARAPSPKTDRHERAHPNTISLCRVKTRVRLSPPPPWLTQRDPLLLTTAPIPKH